MKYYAVEYHVQKNIVCTFDTELERTEWVRQGNWDGGHRHTSDSIECDGMPTHHVTMVKVKKGDYTVGHWEYDPPLKI